MDQGPVAESDEQRSPHRVAPEPAEAGAERNLCLRELTREVEACPENDAGNGVALGCCVRLELERPAPRFNCPLHVSGLNRLNGAQLRDPGIERGEDGGVGRGRWRWTCLGRPQPLADLVLAAKDQGDPPPDEAESGILEHGLAGQAIEPTGHSLALAKLDDEPAPVLGDQLRRFREVAGRGSVRDRLVHGALRLVPGSGAAMKLGEERALSARELASQQVAKEVVIAVPLAARVERHQEEVRAVDLLEPQARVFAAGHRIAKRRAQPLEDRRVEQECPQRGRLLGKQRLEILADLTIVACERLEKGLLVRKRLQRQARKLKARRPALSPGLQELEVGPFQAEVERAVQECVGFFVAEAKLLRPKLRHLPGRAQARERKRRVGAARDRELQRARTMAEQVADRGVDQLVVHEVVVVENQHRPQRRSCELVDQRRQHDVDEAGAGAREPRQRLVAESWVDRPQRSDQVAPEPDRVVVSRVERDPGERSRLIRGGTPFAEENRLPPTRRRAQKRQLALAPGTKRATSSPRETNPGRTSGTCSFVATSTGPVEGTAALTELASSSHRRIVVSSRAGARGRAEASSSRGAQKEWNSQ